MSGWPSGGSPGAGGGRSSSNGLGAPPPIEKTRIAGLSCLPKETYQQNGGNTGLVAPSTTPRTVAAPGTLSYPTRQQSAEKAALSTTSVEELREQHGDRSGKAHVASEGDNYSA